MIVLRQHIKGDVLLAAQDDPQMSLAFLESRATAAAHEYAVLVTSSDYEIRAAAQLYRDRADAENNFDELKNQWGWGGFTTHDLKRCRLMASVVALIYNRWNLCVRLANPHKHHEAITSRPLLLHGVATKTQHGGQTTLTITSQHAKQAAIQAVLTRLATFLASLTSTAEHVTDPERLTRILRHAFAKFLQGRAGPAALLAAGQEGMRTVNCRF